jgi:hypothetical protein
MYQRMSCQELDQCWVLGSQGRFFVSYCNWLWLRVIVRGGVISKSYYQCKPRLISYAHKRVTISIIIQQFRTLCTLKPSGSLMYHMRITLTLFILPTECICVFCMALTINSGLTKGLSAVFRWLKLIDVSGAISVPAVWVWCDIRFGPSLLYASPRPMTLVMGTEMVPETSVSFNQLTWLIARKGLNNFSRHESFTSYKQRRFPYTVLTGWS